MDRIVKAAQVSAGTSSAVKKIILRQKASLLIQFEKHLQELTDILIELCKGKVQGDMDILTSMKGIGEKSAMNFLIEIDGEISV